MNDEQRKLLCEVAFGLGAIRGAVSGLAIATTANNRITSTLDEIEPKIAEVLEPQPEPCWGDHALTKGLQEELRNAIRDCNTFVGFWREVQAICEKYFKSPWEEPQPEPKPLLGDSIAFNAEPPAQETHYERLDRMERQIASAQLTRQRLDLQSKRMDELHGALRAHSESLEAHDEHLDVHNGHFADIDNEVSELKGRVEAMDKALASKAPLASIEQRVEALEKQPKVATWASTGNTWTLQDERVPELVKRIESLENWPSVPGLVKRIEELEKTPPVAGWMVSQLNELDARLNKVIETGAQREQKRVENATAIYDGIKEVIELVGKTRDNSSLRIAIDNLERRLLTAEEQIAGIKKGDE